MGRHKLPDFLRKKRINIMLRPSVLEEMRDFSRKSKKSISRIIEDSWRRL